MLLLVNNYSISGPIPQVVHFIMFPLYSSIFVKKFSRIFSRENENLRVNSSGNWIHTLLQICSFYPLEMKCYVKTKKIHRMHHASLVTVKFRETFRFRENSREFFILRENLTKISQERKFSRNEIAWNFAKISPSAHDFRIFTTIGMSFDFCIRNS
jgi:hypothetical protein